MLSDGSRGLDSTVVLRLELNGFGNLPDAIVDFAGAESARPANGDTGGTVGGVRSGFINCC